MERCLISEPAVLKFDSVQTLGQAGEARRKLLDALATASQVTVDCDEISEVDLGFIQVLLAARHSAKARGIPFTLARPATGPLRDALRRAGLVGRVADGEIATEESFWTETAP